MNRLIFSYLSNMKLSVIAFTLVAVISLAFYKDPGTQNQNNAEIKNPVVANSNSGLEDPKLNVFKSTEEQLRGRKMLSDFVNSRIDSLMNNRVIALKRLKTPMEWKAQQDKTRGQLEDFFGKFPKKTPLNTKITGKIDHEKYSVEKLYFESQPGYYVTANLYIPKKRKGPFPGVLFTSGHSTTGKTSSLYQEACIGMALKGYAVLAIDPMGQGERIEYFDAGTKNTTPAGAVNQHYYLGRTSVLLNWTFSGLRTWDCIRALDYLVTRSEVDPAKLAAVGNSGGGQMALLITAVDPRIKVCAAGHPGGEMEKNYLLGLNLIDRQILSMIAPRPVRIIVGEKSGEEAAHRKKIEDIQLFNEGLGYDKDRAQLVLVDGVHDLKLPKRVKVYEWLNKWFNKEEEGAVEPPLQAENEKDLWVTKSGLTLVSLGGESGQTLNVKRLKDVYKPAADLDELKKRVAKRIRLNTGEKRTDLNVRSAGTDNFDDLSVEKLTYQSEEGILVPSLLIKPKNIKPGSPVYIYASDKGKPHVYQDTLTPFVFAKNGCVVLAIDVRGVGETGPEPPLPLPVKYSTRIPSQWTADQLAIQSPGFGRTMLAMRTFDVMRGIDFIKSRQDLKGRKIILYGAGIGGLWTTLASVYDSGVDGVVTENTLASYKSLINNKYYAAANAYFWLPGALCDFDIPDLARLASSKPEVWLNPVNGLGESLSPSDAAAIIGAGKNIHIISSKKQSTTDILRLFNRND